MSSRVFFGRRWWRAVSDDGTSLGWRTTIQMHPMNARWLLLAYDYHIDETEDHADKDTDVKEHLENFGVRFDGEIVEVKSVKTTLKCAVVEIIVTSVRMKKKRRSF